MMFAEGLFSAITAGLHQPVMACDADGRIRYTNPPVSALSGLACGQLAGMPVQSLLAGCPAPTGAGAAFEARLQTAEGSERPVGAVVTPVCEQGEVSGFVVVLTDLGEADELLERGDCPIMRLSEGARVIFATQTVLQLLDDGIFAATGAAADTVTGQPEGTWAAHLAEVRGQPRQVHSLETHHALAGGGVRWLRWTTRLAPTPEPSPRTYLALAADITAEREAERAWREDAERSRLVLAHSPLGVFVYGPDLRLTDCNERFTASLQSSREKLVGLDLATLRDTSVLPCLRAALGGEEGLYEGRYRATTGSGSPWLVLHTAPLFDDDGRVVGAVGITEDISSRKAAEEEAHRREHELLTLLDNLPGYAFFKDRQGAYVTANEHFCRAVGHSRAAIVGRTDDDLFPAALADKYRADDAAVLASGQPLTCEEQRPDGETTIFAATRRVPLFDGEGQVNGLIGLGFDISDHKRAEDSQRLAAVGQLAAGVAHEFNNLLAAMSMQAELATARAERSVYEELAEVVLRFCRRGAEISRNLTDFAHPGAPKRQTVCLEERVEAALALAARETENAGITVHRDYLSRGALVAGDPTRLQQVFLNLFLNACQAMPSGGVLAVRTRRRELPGALPTVLVSVTDTGAGIRPEHQARIFEPFFTTKGRLGGSDIPGTGLGLSVAHGIVSAHGGTIRVVGEAGRGARFDVELPLLPDSATAPAAEGRRPLRVLVTDDEWDLLAAMGQVLSDHGCEVTCARGTREALAALDRAAFDLVIADWLMPGGGGQAVAARAAAVCEPPCVVIMTGRLEAGAVESVPEFAGLQRLYKPFSMENLRQVVEQVASDRKPASLA